TKRPMALLMPPEIASMSPNERTAPTGHRAVTTLAWCGHVLLAAMLFRGILGSVAPFDGTMYDGPFQLYNGLRRIDAGQRPGGDFVPFHGLGLPLFHYLFYKALGGDLFASEVSRRLVRELALLATILGCS